MMIILPEYSEDQISNDLRRLTEVLDNAGAEVSHGLLGGEYGYGAIYENDVFMMHPYCWCEQEDCPWCVGCSCPDEAFTYKVNGEEVDFEGWMKGDPAQREYIVHEDKQCSYCREESQPAPNFLHKLSGTRITWYKYIGRGMKVELGDDWGLVMESCLDSLRTKRS